MQNPFRYFNSSPAIIRLAVMMYVRFPLSLRQVEDLLGERGIDICHETVRFWWNRFGPLLQRRSGSVGFIFIFIRTRTGAGTWTKCSCGLMGRRTICGVPLIMKAKCSRFSQRNGGIAGLH